MMTAALDCVSASITCYLRPSQYFRVDIIMLPNYIALSLRFDYLFSTSVSKLSCESFLVESDGFSALAACPPRPTPIYCVDNAILNWTAVSALTIRSSHPSSMFRPHLVCIVLGCVSASTTCSRRPFPKIRVDLSTLRWTASPLLVLFIHANL